MNALPDPPPPGLEALLQALRAVGLPLGAREVLRLHHVFALAPALAQERPPGGQLRDLLASALTHDPGERQLFEQIYEPWVERWEQWERSGERRPEPAPRPPEIWAGEPAAARAKQRFRIRWRIAARLAATAILALWVLRPAQFRPVETPDVPPPTFTERGESPAPAPVTIEIIEPALVVTREVRRPVWLLIALGALALLAATGFGWRYARKPWIPDILPDPEPGPARLPLLPFAARGPELIGAAGVRTLVWGVGRHVAEELTTELDLEATVRETARAGGLPELRYAPEKRLREVWLWLDGTTADAAMDRWAEEIGSSLAATGLPVRVGGFDGYPEELLWEEGQLFRPQEVEAHRQTALVAVCTDGAVLARHLEDERAPGVRALLRALAAWPRLAFVDFSNGDSALAAALDPFNVPRVAPDDLPAFFGLGSAPAPRRPQADPGELRTWRATLALGGRPVDRPTAWALRRELGLEVSPWDFHRLQGDEDGEGDETLPRSLGGSLAWSEEGRAALAAWLAETSLGDPRGIREGSVLERALDFWERRLDEEADGRGKRGPLDPWSNRPAERHVRAEKALLRLWREPEEAAEELFELRSGELGDTIRGRLARLAPRDCRRPEDGRAPLPWRLADLGDRTRFLLAELGLGGVTRGDLRRPGRLGLALAALASFGVGLVYVGLAGPRASTMETRPTPSMPLVSIPGGTFLMGSVDDPMAFDSEKPAHEVTVESFWMAQTEVTNAQYRAYKPEHPGQDDLPATGISWLEAREYCQALTESGDWTYDLPTEAEWEYAARAGTTTPWPFAESALGDHAWYSGNFGDRTHEVAAREPNPWGLYDMHGNVWEWVLDCYEAYGERAGDQPIPDPALKSDSCHERDNSPSAQRVLRGGSAWNEPRILRSAYRFRVEPEFRNQFLGFRRVRRPRRQP